MKMTLDLHRLPVGCVASPIRLRSVSLHRMCFHCVAAPVRQSHDQQVPAVKICMYRVKLHVRVITPGGDSGVSRWRSEESPTRWCLTCVSFGVLHLAFYYEKYPDVLFCFCVRLPARLLRLSSDIGQE